MRNNRSKPVTLISCMLFLALTASVALASEENSEQADFLTVQSDREAMINQEFEVIKFSAESAIDELDEVVMLVETGEGEAALKRLEDVEDQLQNVKSLIEKSQTTDNDSESFMERSDRVPFPRILK